MCKNIYSYFVLSICALTTSAQTIRDVPAVTVISSSISHPQTLRDSVTIFYFDKFTIFKISKPLFSSIFSVSKKIDSLEQSQTVQQKIDYFAYRNKDNQGYKITEDTLFKITRERDEFMEDTFLKWSFDFTTPPEGSYTKKIDSTTLYNHIEIFSFNSKLNSNPPDSVILYYGKRFSKVKFNFTDVYGLWRDYKLEKIRFIYQMSHLQIATSESGHKAIEYFSELCSPTSLDYEVANTNYRLLLNKLN